MHHYFTRHGFRQDRDKVWKNTAERPWDPPLSFEHIGSCTALGAVIEKPIEAVYSSPFLRAVQTAHCIANVLKVPVRVEHGLGEKPRAARRETGNLQFSLLSLVELKRHYYTVDTSYVNQTSYNVDADRSEGGKNLASVADVVIPKLTTPCVFVGHGWSTKGLIKYLIRPTKAKIHTPCPGLTVLVKTASGWEIAE